jgi:hypothetical protein
MRRLFGAGKWVFPLPHLLLPGTLALAVTAPKWCSAESETVTAAPPDTPQRPLLYRFLEGGGIVFVLGIGGAAVTAMLLLSLRDSRRMERVSMSDEMVARVKRAVQPAVPHDPMAMTRTNAAGV